MKHQRHRPIIGHRIALAAAIALCGCASPLQEPPRSMRIEPVLRVSDGALGITAESYLALARQYAGEARWPQAATAYRRAVQLDERNADLLNALGHAEAMQGHYEDAVAAFERAVALAPGRADLLNNLGYALLLAGRPTLAAAMLTIALQHAPEHAGARINLQVAEERLAVLRPAPTASVQPSVPAIEPISALDEDPKARITESAALAAPAPVSTPTAATRIVVINGNGEPGAAARVGGWLGRMGMHRTRLANLPPYDTAVTTVRYQQGFQQQALEIARLVQAPGDPQAGPADWRGNVQVLLGRDARFRPG